jgi:hypothetical protein
VIAKLSTSSASSTHPPNPTSPFPHQQNNQEQMPTQAINVEDVVLQPLLQQHGDFGFDLAGFGATALTGDLGFSFEGLGLPFENLWSGFDGNQDGDDGGDGMNGFWDIACTIEDSGVVAEMLARVFLGCWLAGILAKTPKPQKLHTYAGEPGKPDEQRMKRNIWSWDQTKKAELSSCLYNTLIKKETHAARMFDSFFCKYYGKLDGEPDDCMYQAKVLRIGNAMHKCMEDFMQRVVNIVCLTIVRTENKILEWKCFADLMEMKE